MSANAGHLFTVEVRPSQDVAGHFTWAIRDHGKLYRRSDRPHPSERRALMVAEAQLAMLMGLRTAA